MDTGLDVVDRGLDAVCGDPGFEVGAVDADLARQPIRVDLTALDQALDRLGAQTDDLPSLLLVEVQPGFGRTLRFTDNSAQGTSTSSAG